MLQRLCQIRILSILALLFSALSPFALAQRPSEVLDPGQVSAAEATEWVETTLSSFNLEEKVGQLIVATTPTNFTNTTLPPFEKMREAIRRYHLGGYHAFRGSALSAAYLLRRLQEESKVPLLLTADLEGGAGLIFDGATRFPRAMALGATFDPELAFEIARTTAREAHLIGVNLSFSPVADVNNNPNNPIINTRSFGEDPERVADMTAAFVRGLQRGGLLATAKHFPGHGDTDIDSHLELPVISANRERLESVELIPFKRAIQNDVDAIMTAHLSVPALDDTSKRPATLSRAILTDLLRRDLGFSGLIVTDAMNMYAISKNYPAGESAVLALEAGVDIILYPLSVAKTHNAILRAVRSGRISKQRLDRSVRRILKSKARLGLHRETGPKLDDLDHEVGSAGALEQSEQLMERAITLVRNEKQHLPFKRRKGARALVVSVFDRLSSADNRGTLLTRELQNRSIEVISTQVDSNSTQREIALISALARRVDWVILPVFVRLAAFQGSLDLGERQEQVLTAIASSRVPHAVIAFGSPYVLSSVPDLSTYLAAFDDLPAAEKAAVKLILGEIPFRGKLPISLPGTEYGVGHGIQGNF